MFKLWKYFFFAVLAMLIITGCHSSEGEFDESDGQETVELISIQISPIEQEIHGTSELSVPVGMTQSFSALGIYSDGTAKEMTDSVSWSLSNTTTASITNSGLLHGIEAGKTAVMATKDGIKSNQINVEITDAIIIGIQISSPTKNLAKGQEVQLTAIAVYSDETASEVEDSVTWQVSDSELATVTEDGILIGLGEGSITLTAQQEDVISNTIEEVITQAVITDINISTDKLTLVEGQTESLTAIATYTDESESDVTRSVTWTIGNPKVVEITPDGEITGIGGGTSTVSASKSGIDSNTLNMTITEAIKLSSIELQPSTMTVSNGQSIKLTANGIYTDGSKSELVGPVTWLSENPDIASVSLTGVVTGELVGLTHITASVGQIVSDKANVYVTEATITGIQITPEHFNLQVGAAVQLTATATYSDSSQGDVTSQVAWTVSDPEIAAIDVNGLLLGVSEGEVNVSAQLDKVGASLVSVVVSSSTLDVCGHVSGHAYDKYSPGGIDNNDPSNATGFCLKIREVSSPSHRQWFTSTPSKSVMDMLGYTADQSKMNSGDTYFSIYNYTESKPFNFAMFSQYGIDADNTGINGQYDRWCKKLNTLKFAGKVNWRRVTHSEIDQLYNFENEDNLSMYDRFGWPDEQHYNSDWLSYTESLKTGVFTNHHQEGPNFSSCVSG